VLAAAAAACRRQTSRAVFVDPALATLVPADAVWIFGLRLEQIKETTLYRRYIATGRTPLIEQFQRDTGIDVRNDIWEVLIPYDGRTALVMLRGRFTEFGLEPRVNREGARRLGYKGYTILGDDRMAVLFLNPTTAVAAAYDALKRLVDDRDRTAGMPARLAARLGTIAASNQVFFASDFVAGGFDLRDGVKGTAFVDSKEDARRFEEALHRMHRGFEVQPVNTNQLRIGIPAGPLDELMRHNPMYGPKPIPSR
jgi:hypothetical protein